VCVYLCESLYIFRYLHIIKSHSRWQMTKKKKMYLFVSKHILSSLCAAAFLYISKSQIVLLLCECFVAFKPTWPLGWEMGRNGAFVISGEGWINIYQFQSLGSIYVCFAFFIWVAWLSGINVLVWHSDKPTAVC